MSRLYAWLQSDTSKTTVSRTANESIEVNINYGSAGNSKKAVRVCVVWEKGEEKPTVYFTNHLMTELEVLLHDKKMMRL